jgi:hypothetical protein
VCLLFSQIAVLRFSCQNHTSTFYSSSRLPHSPVISHSCRSYSHSRELLLSSQFKYCYLRYLYITNTRNNYPVGVRTRNVLTRNYVFRGWVITTSKFGVYESWNVQLLKFDGVRGVYRRVLASFVPWILSVVTSVATSFSGTWNVRTAVSHTGMKSECTVVALGCTHISKLTYSVRVNTSVYLRDTGSSLKLYIYIYIYILCQYTVCGGLITFVGE